MLLGRQTTTNNQTIISERVLTCDSAHSWQLYSAVPLGNRAMSTMAWYLTQSHYHDTEETSPCPVLIMPSTWLVGDKYQFYASLVWLDRVFEPTNSRMLDPCSSDSATAPGISIKGQVTRLHVTMKIRASCYHGNTVGYHLFSTIGLIACLSKLIGIVSPKIITILTTSKALQNKIQLVIIAILVYLSQRIITKSKKRNQRTIELEDINSELSC